jgi:NADH-quinone oxidoreductase subunit I
VVTNTDRKKTLGEKLILPELVKGYAVTLKTLMSKPSTMQYPEERWKMARRFRGYPKLVMDDTGEPKCVACGLCAVVCPPNAIELQAGETDRVKERFPVDFKIHMGRCINCGYCEEACPKFAIEMSKMYELNTTALDEMIYTKEVLLQDY